MTNGSLNGRRILVSGILTLLVAALVPRPSLADGGEAALPADLDQLAEDFNVMYHRTPILLDLKGIRCDQKQTFLGFYTKNSAGDYVQKNICETLADSSGMFRIGYFDGEQRLTIENGRITLYATYTIKGGQPSPCPSAAVERLGNGIIFREFRGNFPSSWESNSFYITRDGRHESVRTFTSEPQNDDRFVEVQAPGK